MLEKLATSVDKFLDIMTSSFGKKYITDYIDIETVNDENTLVSKDGSLISIIKVRGNLNLYDPSSYYEYSGILESKISALFQKSEHKMQIFFEYDHDNTEKELRDIMSESAKTCERLGISLEDVLQERQNNLLEYVCSESFYIALWTTSEGLSKQQGKNQKEKRLEFHKNNVVPLTTLGQDPLRASTEIIQQHNSFVSNMVSALADVNISTYQVNARSALREMRKCFDKKFTEEHWNPFIPGDTILPSVKRSTPSIETYDIMYPKISHQICPSEAKIIGQDVVEMGERIYSSVFFELFPQKIYSFQNLFVDARNQSLPWRYSLLISGGGLSGQHQFKAMIAHLLAFTNSGNRLMKNDIENLKEYKGAIVEVRATFTTWAPKNNVELLKTRYENLKNVLGKWGSPEVSKTTGDPIAAIASSALSSTQGNIGTKTAAPLKQILFMSPFSRPCSMWENGSVILRSPDGKIIPYEPFSSKQTTWVEVIVGKPGSGKSVLMSVFNLALCLNPGITDLPRIAILDIGYSSAGFVSLVKEALPDNLKHLVVHHTLKNSKEHAVNFFDTPAGCREPIASDRDFIINFVSLLATDPVKDSLDVGMSGLIMKVVDEVYYMKSDNVSPNEYDPSINYTVSKAIHDLEKEKGITLPKLVNKRENPDIRVTWWEIVDFLFDNGEEVASKYAQRYAVPKLVDLLEAVGADRIKNEYSEAEIASFTRNIKDAIGFYPLLTSETKFDFDVARIIAIDLNEVANGSGSIGERMTTVMYMVARFLLAKDFYIDEKIEGQVPTMTPTRIELRSNVPVKKYKDYHYKRGLSMKKEQKRLVYDEFHRVSTSKSAKYVVKQVEDDVRVGRKYQIDIMLGSQALTDFDKTLLGFTTGVFILDSGNKQMADNIKDLLGMDSDIMESVLRDKIKSPRKGGGVFLARFETTEGVFHTLASATLGPVEMWAFTTTAADVYVRNGLYRVMNSSDARKLLARYYKSGSIKSEVENIKEKMQRGHSGSSNEGVFKEFSQEEMSDIYEKILKELIEKAKNDGIAVKD